MRAIVIGQAKAGRIVVVAAIIMVLVFGSFLLSGNRVLEVFGFGLGFAVLVDAVLIRMVPATGICRHGLERILPNLSIEPGDEPDDQPGDEPAIEPRPVEPAGVG